MLEKGNLSWRWYSQKLEYIRPVTEYIDYAHQPNYEDFVGDGLNPGFVHDFGLHDKTVNRVESKAVAFYERLMQSNIFHRQVKVAYQKCGRFIAGFKRKLTSTSVCAELNYWIRRTQDYGQIKLWI